MHKAIYTKKTKYIHNKLVLKIPSENNPFPMRQLNKVKVPDYRKTISRRSFCYRSAKLRKDLPSQTREIKPYKKFKYQLKNWIIMNIPQKTV